MVLSKVISKLSIMLLSGSLISCAGNMESMNANSTHESISSGLSVDEGISEKTLALMQEVDKEEETAETLYNEVVAQEKKMKKINILSFLLAVPFKATNNQTTHQKLKNPIKSVLVEALDVVDRAYALDDKLRKKLDIIVADLNPELPLHAKAIKRIEKMHKKLDRFDEKLSDCVVRLIVVTNKVISKIKLKASTYFPLDPRALLLKKAKSYFDDFKDDLEGYIFEEDL